MKEPALQNSPKKRGRKLRKWIYLVALLACAGFAYWYFFMQEPSLPAPVIRYGVADRGDIVKSITSTGTLQATKTVQVGSQVSGTIRAMYADFNSKVTQGDVIARLDPTFYEAAVKQAEANYFRAEADAANSHADSARAAELYSKQLLARADYDAAMTKTKTANATVAQTRAQLEQAKVNLGYTIIRAPISGTVVSRDVDVGQTVAASLNAPVLFTIAEDLGKMEVYASVDEADVGEVKYGQEVHFTVDAFPNDKFKGEVSMVRINPTITQNVVTYTVIVSTSNPDLKLLPGMTATATIISDQKHDVLRIPSASLRFRPPKDENDTMSRPMSQRRGNMNRNVIDVNGPTAATIFKKKGNSVNRGDREFESIRVTTGISDGTYTEIILEETNKQLSQGDSIAVGSFVPSSNSENSSQSQTGGNPFGGSTGGGSRGMRRVF